MPEISAVIITLNEELNIERCLQSVKEIADEIVVIDSFSTDRTEEICQKYGVKFSCHPFEGYVEQKSYVISQASNDYILLIDADEALSDELRASIREVKANWTHDGYEFNRLNSYCGKWIRHSGWYPDRKIRLFDRRKALVKGKNPHDVIVMADNSTVKHLKGDLLHYTYLSVEDHIHQINRFTEIQARGSFERGRKASYLSIFFSPPYKFIRHYFFRLGFLDGYYGFLICRNSAYSNFLKHAKLKALWKMKGRKHEK
ncbi:MAG: glycosyltransferase family 2 protein [Bacteroidales bacterium]|nr:glycosyltransferase family 2 protein [Bacteroidales bacterium]